MKVILGLLRANNLAQPTVSSKVSRSYSARSIPTDETPRQNKHASNSLKSAASTGKSKRSGRISSRSFGSDCPDERRPIERTAVTLWLSKHSRKTACPTIPEAPNRITFMNPFQTELISSVSYTHLTLPTSDLV